MRGIEQPPPGWLDFAAGCFAAAFSKTITSPLYVVKNLVLIQSTKPLKEGLQLGSTLRTFRSLYAEKGFLAFWSGNAITMLRSVPYTGIKFVTFDQLRFYLLQNHGKGNPEFSYNKNFLAGCGAGLFASLLTHPLWLIKMNATKLHSEEKILNRGLSLVTSRAMYREGGTPAFFKGLTLNIAGAVPFEGVLFMLYQAINSWWPKKDRGIRVHLTAGLIAASVAQTLAHPLHVLKERVKKYPVGSSKMNVFTFATQIIRQDGFLGLYRGTLANLVKSAPYLAIQFAFYEQCIKFL